MSGSYIKNTTNSIKDFLVIYIKVTKNKNLKFLQRLVNIFI